MEEDPHFKGKTSYIMSDYVKYIEAQGARVVPILYDESDETTLDKINHLDGVFLPGGGGNYYDKGEYILKEVIKKNDAGHFYPIWGTCLGYEHLVTYTADSGRDALGRFPLHKVSIPIKFLVDPTTTKMY